MKKLTFSLLLLAAGAFSASHASSVIKESTVGVPVLQKVYIPAGIGADLPKVLVFGADGACLGAAGHSEIENIEATIKVILSEPIENCKLHISSQFGAPQPSADGGPGKVVIQLLTFAGDLCQACSRMEAALKALVASGDYDWDWRITRISLEKSFNPEAQPKGECPQCEKKTPKP